MSRRFPQFVPTRFHLHTSSNSNFSSSPRLLPKEPRIPKSRLSTPIPLEKLLAEHRRSRGQSPNHVAAEISSQESNRELDSAYHDLVCRYKGSRNPHDVASLHLELIKKGFVGDLFLSNNLINLYAKAGNLACAYQVFDDMPEKNAVSWTCLIAGHTRHGLPDEACYIFRLMILNGFEPTQFTFGSALRACQDFGPDRLSLGTQIHGLLSKTQHSLDTVVCNALMSMYGSCCLGYAFYAQQVFDSIPIKNSITWNCIISVHSNKGDAMAAFKLFSDMQMGSSGFDSKPNEYTYGSLISMTYSSSCGMCLLEQMLARVSKSGFLSDLYVGSALVSAFARFGLLDRAKKIFLQMDEKNAVSMNGLMVGLVKQNLGQEAVDVFRETRNLVMINYDSYVVLMSALAEFSVLEEGRRKGREVHGLVVRAGLMDSKVAIGNGLLNMYAKCGAIDEACRVFKLMTMKDQVSWNTMISGLDQNGYFEKALMSFLMMLRNGIMPSNYAIISALSSCASLRVLSAGVQLHCDGIKLGFDLDVSVSNSLLAMYGECGALSECWRVFSYMPDYDQISWNSMIGALASSEASLQESIGVFLDMMRNGWKPNRVTFMNIFAVLSPLSVLELGRQVHALVLKHGVSEDSAVENALLSCYAKSGEIDDCERLFFKMSDRRDDVSWNSMVAGYVQNGLLQKAMDFVWFMIHSGQQMDCFTLATVLSACASVAALERGLEIHAFGVRCYLVSDVVVESALVDMYSKCGRVDYASRVFRFMSLRNEFSWNSMISAYARHGLGEEALEVFKEMQCRNQRPDHVTYVGVLSACSHAGLVEEGLKYFESMGDYGLVPRMEHYSCMIDLLGRAGKLDKVEEFVKGMPMSPNVLIWRTVLVACRQSKDDTKTELAKLASKMLVELEPQNPVNYVLTSNFYASKGRWEDVAKARAAMQRVTVKKEAGCSWVTFRDGVHVFVAGDRSHPNTEEIYAKLRVLNQKMRDAGYVPQTEFALYDLDMENKEELLSHHSEKLAVAFVLTRSSGTPIRIMKNLRVCGDCHSAFRYISKIAGREIILRDSNRFHHFVDGKCSCGDYW
ncbi:putative pentatricopeptide repeat-containing protein At5g09950 [Elaeis guineensis]|uniref:Pentatricopeptide repeat-containing protein At5g09950 n=1 Tax=Elaeis guineensis var. tenera TaxID=51953 RepID=A0A6I9RR29_ELAGV|nr:putative pentatricopeptide repeat-containing protein At5g09950 [Elaeis guineensis]